MAKVSLVVPIYNSSMYLNKCIDSLVNQTLKDIEIILINDGSTDKSEKIIKEYNDKRIKYISKKNEGIGKTRNRGIKEATGEYIAFVDSDDYLNEHFCEYMYKKASTDNCDLVICNFFEDRGNLYGIKFKDFEDTSLKDNPSLINIYAKDFDSKEKVTDLIESYNKKQQSAGNDEDIINYSDLVGMMMSSVKKIINMISYVLIAFVAVSLVVSSIMIGIITYISVLERTKEIGILRSLGASKKDISRVFNAETFIIGLTSGVIGIGVTVLITIPASIIVYNMTGIANIASLPVVGAIILIVISMILTIVAGLIPSRIASKKDPVEALRTE